MHRRQVLSSAIGLVLAAGAVRADDRLRAVKTGAKVTLFVPVTARDRLGAPTLRVHSFSNRSLTPKSTP